MSMMMLASPFSFFNKAFLTKRPPRVKPSEKLVVLGFSYLMPGCISVISLGSVSFCFLEVDMVMKEKLRDSRDCSLRNYRTFSTGSSL